MLKTLETLKPCIRETDLHYDFYYRFHTINLKNGFKVSRFQGFKGFKGFTTSTTT